MLDIGLSVGLLIFCLPLMLMVAAAIKVQDGGPVLFGHGRIGRGGAAFRCWKFRSMVVDAEARLAAVLASNPAARAEWQAAAQRAGRRHEPGRAPPIVMAEVARHGRWFRHYCSVRPGITGLWQVSGRNDVDYRRRVAVDVLFVMTRSAQRYLWILVMTVPAVAKRQGSY